MSYKISLEMGLSVSDDDMMIPKSKILFLSFLLTNGTHYDIILVDNAENVFCRRFIDDQDGGYQLKISTPHIHFYGENVSLLKETQRYYMNTQKNLTIKDIARLANVSHATVSRVLTNADYPVSRELRERILRIAKENHYTPNISGRLLKQAHSSDVGILIPDYTNLYYTTIIEAMDTGLSGLGADLLIMRTGSSPEAEISAVERMLARRVCALILTEKPHDAETVDRILEKGVIPVLINSSFEKAGCVSIHTDTEYAGLLVAEHLAQQGHSCAAFINSHVTKEHSYRDGIRSAFQQYGIRCVEMYPDSIKDGKEPQHGFSVGLETAEYLPEQVPDATVYVCSNDMVAAGALSALQKKGIRVPEDISVIGRDNVLISRILYPAITTLEEPYEEIAEYAVSVIRDGIDKTGFLPPIKIKPRLIIRASTEKNK